MVKKGRGFELTDRDKLFLVAKAAGLCEFRGCGKALFLGLTDEKLNISQFAHIIASSPNGPRGSDKSHDVSNKIENVMLLCPEHHKEIDGVETRDKYNVDCLLEMKHEHERKVSELSVLFKSEKAEVVIFSSPIAGKKVVTPCEDVMKSVYPPFTSRSDYARKIEFDLELLDDGKGIDWKSTIRKLKRKVRDDFSGYLESGTPIGLFALGVCPILIALGSCLGNKAKIEVYPKLHDSNLWRWDQSSRVVDFFYEKTINGSSKNVVLIIDISAKVDVSKIKEIKDCTVYRIYPIDVEPSIDLIKNRDSLQNFIRVYYEVQNLILSENSLEVYLYAAVPNVIAIAIGQNRHTAHQPMNVMEMVNGVPYKTFCLE